MKRKITIVLIVLTLIGLMSFIAQEKVTTIQVVIQGKIINLKSEKPLKRLPIHISVKRTGYMMTTFLPFPGKTNSKGEFFIEAVLPKDHFEFWIGNPSSFGLNKFTGLHVYGPSSNSAQSKDTINLGDVYLIPYDNELEVFSALPRSKIKGRKKLDKFTLNQIDSIFSLPNNSYNMEMNPIDTTVIPKDRYEFNLKKPRGGIKAFKTIEFKRILNQ